LKDTKANSLAFKTLWQNQRMRIVLDTDVVVAAFRSNTGASRAILDLAVQRSSVTMAVSVPLLVEYEAVLKRDDQRLVHGLTDAQLERALQLITQASDLQSLHFLWRPQLQDVGDEMVLETAINARVDMLVSFNQRHLHTAAAKFGLRCVVPATCLFELEKPL
jgi:putative PIN family toxin of toxin-antitoxin system